MNRSAENLTVAQEPTTITAVSEQNAYLRDIFNDRAIVYPSRYKDWQMTEVFMLRDVIEHLTGKAPMLISDKEAKAQRELIFASSERSTAFADNISGLGGAMDYIIAADENDIVIGGQNYYSDMRAAYDIINNYLGYDDINDTYSEPTKQICGISEVAWKKPELYIMGTNMSCGEFEEAWQVKDFADCNFNLLQISSYGYKKPENVRNVAAWCARFGIELIIYPATDKEKQQVIIPCEEDLLENPAIYGLYIVDEPYLEEQHLLYRATAIAAKEKYGKYGWQIYINAAFVTDYPTAPIDFDENDVWTESASVQWRKYYADVADILSFDMCPYQSKFEHRERYTCLIMEQASKMAKYLAQTFFVYIDAYNLANRGYCDKMFRTHSYLLLSFGVQGIEYFQYGDASKNYRREGDWSNGSLINWDYSKNEYWYDAKKINAKLKKLAPVYAQYKHIGAYAINKPEGDNTMYLHAPCDSFGVIEAVDDSLYRADQGRSSTYLVGCFESIHEGEGKAFTLVNMDVLDDVKYGEQKVPPIKLKINGEKVTCYKNGEAISMKSDQNGYYSFSMPNGECVFVTVQ